MDPNQKPSFQEWLRDNPGKGINDYFSKYGEADEPVSSGQPILVNPTIKRTESRRSTGIEWFTMLISLAMIGSFYLPWIDVRLFGGVAEGMIKGGAIAEGFGLWEESFLIVPDGFLLHYLIPLGAGMALLGALLRWYWMKYIGAALSAMLVIRWLIVLVLISYSEQFAGQDIWTFIGTGTYLAASCAMLYLFDFLREWF